MSDRYRTAAELLADLKTAKEQLKSSASQSDLATKESRRFSWSITAILVLLIAATVGTILYRQSRAPAVQATNAPAKPYSEMSDRERLDFVATQEQRISAMMGDRSLKLNDDAINVIKAHVDSYASKINNPASSNSEGMAAVYERARPYVPLIARSFANRKVPIIIGIYLPVIESGYRHCYESPLGAKGLFQFLPQTAKSYGVAREEMCNAEKMAPAAAHYIADRMAELGEDADSVTLVLLSYNRGEDWVRDTLRQLRGRENYERNFWTLLTNRETLGDAFRNETAGYVPSFFAAAIIGENPETFGLHTPPLSSLAVSPRQE